jgi:hypothetical protein
MECNLFNFSNCLQFLERKIISMLILKRSSKLFKSKKEKKLNGTWKCPELVEGKS